LRIILERDQAYFSLFREAFNPSDTEDKFIINIKAGREVLVEPEGRLPFYNFPSDEEKSLSRTKPRVVTA